jgi:exosortase/archaeosortase family protein
VRTDDLKLEGANLFALSIATGFLLPLVIPNVGLDYPYFFVTVIVLLAWFMIKWDAVKGITIRSKNLEKVAGLGLISAIYAFNEVRGSSIGIIDLNVILLGSALWVFGLRSLKSFWVPAAYGIVLLAGYQIENHTPNYSSLQNWLAGVMAGSMNAIGVGAQATGQYVSMSLPNGTPLLLSLDGACTGLQGILAFGMLSTMAMLDAKPKLARVIPIIVLGFLGAFFINIVRLFVVFVTFEFLGVEAGTTMHVYFGYFVFFIWIIAFWSLAFRYLLPKQVAIPSQAASAGSPPLRVG